MVALFYDHFYSVLTALHNVFKEQLCTKAVAKSVRKILLSKKKKLLSHFPFFVFLVSDLLGTECTVIM